MNERAELPRLVALGRVAVAVQQWRYGGATRLTIVVKAVAALCRDGSTRLQEPEPVRHAEKHELPGPVVISPTELIPALERPEVTLVASAHAAEPVEHLRVRLALRRPNGPVIIDKTLDVRSYDDKGAPVPFKTMPLDYSRAIGGIGRADNPLGRGLGPSANEKPCVVDPIKPERVACFAPIPAAFGERRRLLGGVEHKRIVGTHIDIPDGFDWQFFQAAPHNQRVKELSGDEQITLQGMHPERPVWTCALPGWRALCRLYGTNSGSHPQLVPLRLECLHIDADAGRCQLIWRVSVPWLESLRGVTVAAQLQSPGAQATWPTHLDAHSPSRIPAPAALADLTSTDIMQVGGRSATDLTTTFSPTSTLSVPATRPDGPTLPFVAGGEAPPVVAARPAGDIPGAPWSRNDVARPVRPAQSPEETLDTDASASMSEHDQGDRTGVPLADQGSPARAEAHAEARRAAEARKFAEEQAQARAAARERVAKERLHRQSRAKSLSDALYGGFRKS